MFFLLRTGEFRVEVTASNLVSSASLSSHIFVVDQPCQPPPVKNMGPLKLQVALCPDLTSTSGGAHRQYNLLFAPRYEDMRLSIWV